MTGGTAVAFAIGLPIFGMVLILLNDRYPNLRDAITLATSACLALIVFGLVPEVTSGGRPGFVLAEIVPGLAIAFEVEPLGMLFAMVASGLWVVTTFYSIGYMRSHHEENQTRFYACFAIAISSAMGICFSANMLTLFIFYEILTISTYPLVIHSETKDAVKAGRTYLGILIGTSIAFLLMAIIWTWFLTGTLDFTPGGILKGKAEGPILGLLLFLYMYGIGKAALMPIHRWLPAAMVAPTPVSALLHAVAVVKAGVFTVLKVIVYIFGIDTLAGIGQDDWLMYIAAFTVIVASCVALTKDNLKARLAYSTVSQLSYIVLGAALANSIGIIGGGMHIAMHAFGKITLFFCAGAILVASHKTEISEMDGLGRVMPFTFIAFLIGSLSVIGLPPLGGSWSKWYLMLSAAEANLIFFMIVFMASSLLNIAYLMPLVARGFFLPERKDDHHDDHHEEVDFWNGVRFGKIKEAPPFCLFAMTITSAGCILLFFYADRIYKMLAPVAGIQG
ncbi:MAG: cation:proton antiporter [Rhodospirillaceae bacterium]|nr:cation:proton antiporter [Rhodospirillaceae bacterium]|tara:strand:+ start:7691 stop:9205 length:1515 start_codon:yes stop_codon:yes gene_type:complete